MSSSLSQHIVDMTQETFEQEVAADGLTVIDFWAPWCGPCVAMAPQFERAAQLRPAYRFGKVNVDEEPELASTFGVMSIPTIAVLRDGELVGTAAGAVGAEQLVAALDKVAA